MDNSLSRRTFLSSALAAGTASIVAPGTLLAHGHQKSLTDNSLLQNRPKVLFFDVNETLLDLTSMKGSIGKALNNRTELLPLWFSTMLHYSLVSTVGNQYHDFGAIGVAALQMVARNNAIVLNDDQAKEAMKPILSLPPHPDVPAALKKLKNSGYTMVSFTNSSNKAVETQLANAGIIDLFDMRLSIEDIGKFKPHIDAYNWASRKAGAEPGDCMLIAAHGWDIAGAKWAGWRTAFLSRPGQQLYPLSGIPEYNVPDLQALAKQLVSL